MKEIFDTVVSVFSVYGWAIYTWVGSPYVAWRVTQWYKLVIKKRYGRKPHWLLLDVASWVIVYIMSYQAWIFQTSDRESALYIAFIVACLHTGIVKALFKFAPKPVADALQHGVYVNGDKTKFLAATVIGYGGEERRAPDRSESELDDITQPKGDR